MQNEEQESTGISEAEWSPGTPPPTKKNKPLSAKHRAHERLQQQNTSGGLNTPADPPQPTRMAGRIKPKGGETNMAQKSKKAAAAPAASTVDPMDTVNAKYRDKVVRVTETSPKGKATRVVISCQADGCDNEREIATQDLFQVSYCTEHRGGRKTAKEAPAPKAAAKAAPKGKKGKAAPAAK